MISAKWKRIVGIAAGLILSAVVLALTTADRFLAVEHPTHRGVLVVESWIPPQSIAESARLFKVWNYKSLVVVGNVNNSKGTSRYVRTPETVRQELLNEGIAPSQVFALETRTNDIGRTIVGARAVDTWFQQSNVSACCIDVFTLGVHGRKSWIAYKYVFGDDRQIGIISAREIKYDAQSWRWSKVRLYIVGRNLIGYAAYKLWILQSTLFGTKS